jgi:hypothetical protein
VYFSSASANAALSERSAHADLRLDHPELGEVAAGVRVFGAEGRPERINLGQRQAIGVDIELPRHRQERLAAEEIVREIHLAVWVRGRLAKSRLDNRNRNPSSGAAAFLALRRSRFMASLVRNMNVEAIAMVAQVLPFPNASGATVSPIAVLCAHRRGAQEAG